MTHPPPTFSIATEHGRLAGWRRGSGPPALILHGGPGLSDYTAGLAAELEDTFECIRYQQRGLAPSATTGPKAVEAHVSDALAILDGLEIERALVVGHSWGGHLAAHVVAHHPDRALGLVSISGIGAVDDGGWAAFDEEMDRRLPPENAELLTALDERFYAGQGSPGDAGEMMRLRWPAYFPPASEPPPVPDFDFDLEGFAETHSSVLELASTGDLERRVRTLELPALFLHGEYDPVPLDVVRATAAIMKRAELEVLPGIGHFPWLESPGSIAPLITRWWAKVRAG